MSEMEIQVASIEAPATSIPSVEWRKFARWVTRAFSILVMIAVVALAAIVAAPYVHFGKAPEETGPSATTVAKQINTAYKATGTLCIQSEGHVRQFKCLMTTTSDNTTVKRTMTVYTGASGSWIAVPD